MIALGLVLIYAVLMSVLWVVMRALMIMGTDENPFPGNIIRADSVGICLVLLGLYVLHFSPQKYGRKWGWAPRNDASTF